MRIAHFDCYSGISGDMTIGALLDAGLPMKALSIGLKKLNISGYEIGKRKVRRGELVGTKFDCLVRKHSDRPRPLKAILKLIDGGSLSKKIKDTAKDIFRMIGRAEARVHGINKYLDIELHELGQIDSIIDIVGTAIAVDELAIDKVFASDITLGRTLGRAGHGTIPLPGPATLEILKGVPVTISKIKAELVTPTGAGILKSLSSGFGEMPRMKISEIGYGAGSIRIKELPNMLRVIIGEGFKILFLLSAVSFQLAAFASADTIRMNDGREIKGIVVEDYRDRMTFSTADGEVTIMKSDVREFVFDSEEDNLIKLAELAQERKDYQGAYSYYEMASRLNPNSKQAKDGMVFLHGYLLRKDEVKREDEIKRQEDIERYGARFHEEKGEEAELADAARLKKSTGISLKMHDGLPEVESVSVNSPAYEAGIRKGDLLVAIWGRLTGYMPLASVMAVLVDKPHLEIKCTIERTIALDSDEGASFNMEFDGLAVSNIKEESPASASGLKKGDLIVAIDGHSTRYMPLKKAMELIKGAGDSGVKLAIRRELLLWRKEGV